MSIPFLALAPNIPRVVDIAYSAMLLPCVDVTDLSDVSDQTDQSDFTDGGGDVII